MTPDHQSGGIRPLTSREWRLVYTRREVGDTFPDIGAEIGIPGNILKDRYARAVRNGTLAAALAETAALDGPTAPAAPPPPPIVRAAEPAEAEAADSGMAVRREEYADGSIVLEAPSSSLIRTLDELLAIGGVDSQLWRVERHLLNAWGVGMKGPDGHPATLQLHQVKAWLVPRRDVIDAKAVIDQMIEDAAGHMPRYAMPAWSKVGERERHLWIVSPADLHLGMLAWAPEAGEDYDSKIAADLAATAVADLLGKAAGFPAERIVILLGNDLVHADRTVGGAGGQTMAGTQVDVDGRWQRLFTLARRVAVGMIDMCRPIAPVEAVIIQGNHGGSVEFYLGAALEGWYRLDGAVTIRNDPRPRQYLRYGSTLIGMAHGHRERGDALPLLMAQEAPQDWAETTTRDWLLGHLHRKGADEEERTGVRMIVMPSLVPSDAWHAGKGYRHRRTCEARIYHHDDGLAATVSYGPPRSSLDTTPA